MATICVSYLVEQRTIYWIKIYRDCITIFSNNDIVKIVELRQTSSREILNLITNGFKVHCRSIKKCQ